MRLKTNKTLNGKGLGKGWHNDSIPHSLAAKGIKSKSDSKKYPIVERDWIHFYDTIEPAKKPLSSIPQSEREKITGAYKEKMRQYHKEYQQKPEVKERQKQKAKEYRQRPEVKQRDRLKQSQRYQTPEAKERRKQYQKEYRQKPGVKERLKQYGKEYRQIPKIKKRDKLRHDLYTLIRRVKTPPKKTRAFYQRKKRDVSNKNET